MRKMLITEPTYFTVAYELPDNRWMNINNQPNAELARKQWRNLKNIYEGLGVSLNIEPGAPGLPDFTFVANAGLPFNQKIILSNFRHPERRPEKEIHRNFFRDLGFEIIELHPDTYFEGQGDAVWYGNSLLLGHGFRTSLDAARQLEKILSVEVIPLRLVEPSLGNKIFYHLDTCFLHLRRSGVCAAVKRAFAEESWRKLERICNIVDIDNIDPKAAEMLFCNSVESESWLVTPYVSEPIAALLDRYDYRPMGVDMSEFLKSGGAVKCLTLEFS